MKRYIFLMFILLGIISCTKENYNEIIQGEYYLSSISGGISGQFCSYGMDEFVWIFDEEKVFEIIQFTEIQDCFFSENSSNQFSFEVKQNEDGYFLFIDNKDRGLIKITEDGFSLNRNLYFNGNSASDTYGYNFLKL